MEDLEFQALELSRGSLLVIKSAMPERTRKAARAIAGFAYETGVTLLLLSPGDSFELIAPGDMETLGWVNKP